MKRAEGTALQGIRSMLRTLIVIALCAPLAVGAAQDGGDHGPLPRSDLFHPLLADPKQPQFFASFVSLVAPRLETQAVAVGLGENIGLFRSLSGHWQLNIAAGAFSQFNMQTASNDLLNTDYIVGFPLSWRSDGTSARFRFYHQSSHLGDEFLLHAQPTRVNLSYEAVEVLASHELGGWRAYGGGEYILRRDPDELDRALLHAGLEYRNPGTVMRLGRWGPAGSLPRWTRSRSRSGPGGGGGASAPGSSSGRRPPAWSPGAVGASRWTGTTDRDRSGSSTRMICRSWGWGCILRCELLAIGCQPSAVSPQGSSQTP